MTCLVRDCPVEIGDTAVYCEEHYAMLLPATRGLLNKTYRPGLPASRRFVWAVEQARREITYFAQHGHRIPVNVMLGDIDAGR